MKTKFKIKLQLHIHFQPTQMKAATECYRNLQSPVKQTYMNFHFPATDCLISQYLHKRCC